MKKSIITLSILLFSCTEDSPTLYYSVNNFDILQIGSNIVDLIIADDGKLLIAADSGNNRIIMVDISGDMEHLQHILVGSEPTSLALSEDESKLYVGLSGSSHIAVVDLETFNVTQFMLDEDGPMDVEISGNYLITTFISDQSIYHRTKMYDLATGEMLSSKPKAGLLSLSEDGSSVFVLDQSFERVNLFKYILDGNTLAGNIQSSDIIPAPAELYDIEVVPGLGVVLALSGNDFEEHEINHGFLYEMEQLNLTAHFDVKSPPLAVATSPNGESIFFSPSKPDGVGTFIIEFDRETYLQRNYYLTAGKLSPGALIIDPSGEYIYLAVDDMADNLNDEPYSSNTFDIQKIKIEPIGTFPINDF